MSFRQVVLLVEEDCRVELLSYHNLFACSRAGPNPNSLDTFKFDATESLSIPCPSPPLSPPPFLSVSPLVLLSLRSPVLRTILLLSQHLAKPHDPD